MSRCPDMPPVNAIRARADLIRQSAGQPEAARVATAARTADMLDRIADALEAAPQVQPAPVDLAAIRSGDSVTIKATVKQVDPSDNGFPLAVSIVGEPLWVSMGAIRAHYPQPRPALEWGPVMVTEDGEPALAATRPDAQGLRSITMHWSGDPDDVATWYCHPDGDPIPSPEPRQFPRIVGPWPPTEGVT